jgi:apolipoprotein N-acyltransferase
MSPQRYDKIHLVPFGEFIPFKQSIPMLYNLFLKMSPYDYDYTLTSGVDNGLTVFTLEPGQGGKSARPARFVVPICFEDIDSTLVARMFRPGESRQKRADFIVNLTNDGWFKANEPAQHLQAAVFRSIENRAPTARSVNTGISAFIDSYGRVLGAIPRGREGTLTQPLTLDNRLTLYTRFGDVFADLCIGATVLLAAAAVVMRRKKRLAADQDQLER